MSPSFRSTVTCIFFLTHPASTDADEAGLPRTPQVRATIKRLGGSVRQLPSGSLDVAFHLRGRTLRDVDLPKIATLNNVVSLNLRDTRVTSAGLAHLTGMQTLRRLHLERTQVDDTGMQYVGRLANLEYLNLYKTRITDRALTKIAGLKNLKRVYLWQTRVSDQGVATLQLALPKLKIVRGVELSKLPKTYPQERKPEKPKLRLTWRSPEYLADGSRSKSGANAQVFFENKSQQPVRVYWITYDGGRKLYATLAPGKLRQQNTYANNIWLITDLKDNPLGFFIIGSKDALAVIPPRKKG